MPAEKVTTVLGGISPEALGFCQMHEHIMLRKGVPALLDPALMADDIEKSTQELSLLRAAWERYVFPSANGFYRHYLSSFAAARIKLRYSSAARSVLLSPKV